MVSKLLCPSEHTLVPGVEELVKVFDAAAADVVVAATPGETTWGGGRQVTDEGVTAIDTAAAAADGDACDGSNSLEADDWGGTNWWSDDKLDEAASATGPGPSCWGRWWFCNRLVLWMIMASLMRDFIN